MVTCILSSAIFLMRWKGNINYLLLNEILFVNMQSRKKVNKNIGNNVKKEDWYYSKVFRHAKNQKLLASYNHESVINQIANGKAKEKAKKVMQFGTILHLLEQGCLMLEYEAMRALFEFLAIKK